MDRLFDHKHSYLIIVIIKDNIVQCAVRCYQHQLCAVSQIHRIIIESFELTADSSSLSSVEGTRALQSAVYLHSSNEVRASRSRDTLRLCMR